LTYVDDAAVHDIGQMKIGRFGMGPDSRPSIPPEFDQLGEQFLLAGADDSYYQNLRDLGDQTREAAR
jgi:hypothetical protein